MLVWILWGIKLFLEVNYNVYLGLDKYKPQPEHIKNQFKQLRLREAQLQESKPLVHPFPKKEVVGLWGSFHGNTLREELLK